MYPSFTKLLEAPICNNGTKMQVGDDTETVRFTSDTEAMDSDSRLCQHCLKEARYNASHQ